MDSSVSPKDEIWFRVPSHFKRSRLHLTNLWYACPKRHAAFPAVPIFLFLLPDQLLHIVKNMHVYTNLSSQRLHMNYRCYQITLQCNIFTQIGAVRSVDRIFIIDAPAWRWMGKYVTIDKMVYSLLSKQETVAPPVTATFSSLSLSPRRTLF